MVISKTEKGEGEMLGKIEVVVIFIIIGIMAIIFATRKQDVPKVITVITEKVKKEETITKSELAFVLGNSLRFSPKELTYVLREAEIIEE